MCTILRSTEGAVRGRQYGPRPSISQYNPKSVASRVVLTDVGRNKVAMYAAGGHVY